MIDTFLLLHKDELFTSVGKLISCPRLPMMAQVWLGNSGMTHYRGCCSTTTKRHISTWILLVKMLTFWFPPAELQCPHLGGQASITPAIFTAFQITFSGNHSVHTLYFMYYLSSLHGTFAISSISDINRFEKFITDSWQIFQPTRGS